MWLDCFSFLALIRCSARLLLVIFLKNVVCSVDNSSISRWSVIFIAKTRHFHHFRLFVWSWNSIRKGSVSFQPNSKWRCCGARVELALCVVCAGMCAIFVVDCIYPLLFAFVYDSGNNKSFMFMADVLMNLRTNGRLDGGSLVFSCGGIGLLDGYTYLLCLFVGFTSICLFERLLMCVVTLWTLNWNTWLFVLSIHLRESTCPCKYLVE